MNRKGKISASMMCTGLDKIFYYLTEFKEAEIEFLHIDIMDGSFVPNLALGTDYVKSLRRISDIPFDFHFLVNNPLEKMGWFDIRENDQVAVHYENNGEITKCLEYLKRLGAISLIAINPETDYKVLDPYLDDIDGILVMTVNPGFAGKKLLPFTVDKVKDMRDYYNSIGYKDIFIEVDGNISIKNAKILYESGAEVFVAGSSSLFKKGEKSTHEIIEEKRKAIGWYR
ncbi:MAG: ribulose-phosphate 3-epimerase [Anaerovoracaceae bacterium]